MAIKGFKDIIDRKGYKVDSEDRKVFEKEISKSNFGLGCSDMIEFILFDSSENKLPQGDDGKLVRYINLDDSNIKDYFIISDNQFTKKKDGTPEFIVDLEKLINEAGYSNGIFKTQVTLLNRRAGVDGSVDNSLWIHEISPSRTEIRILPNRAKGDNTDLEKRLSVFLDNGTFRDDVIYYINVFIDKLNLEKILRTFLFSKGTEDAGITYINLIKTEFKIESFEILLNRVKTKFVESMKHYSERRNWKINDINYGKPLGDKDDCIDLSIPQLERDAQQSLINCIDFYLPKRNIVKDNVLSKEEQITLDKVKRILKTTTSKSIYDSTVPDKVNARIRGCTDPNAENYNPLAQDNDGSCIYKIVKDEKDEIEEEDDPFDDIIRGCTSPKALNYNPNATVDDGSCKFKGVIPSISKVYYVWSAKATMKWKQNGKNKYAGGVEYQSFSITHDVGAFKFTGDVREVPKIKAAIKKTISYLIKNIAKTYGRGSSIFAGKRPRSVLYKDALGNLKTSSVLFSGDSTTICAQKGSVIAGSGIEVTIYGPCGTPYTPPKPKTPIPEDVVIEEVVIEGCTNPIALNFNPSATVDDGSCTFKPKVVETFTEEEDINGPRGSGFDDEFVMINEDGVAVRPEGNTDGGLPGDLVGNGTGDISQGGGYGPIIIKAEPPTKSGGGESNRKDIERLSGNVVLEKAPTPKER